VWQLTQAFLLLIHASISDVMVVSVPFFKDDFLPPTIWQMAHELMGTSGLTMSVCCSVMLIWQMVQAMSWLPVALPSDWPPPSCWKVMTLRIGNSTLVKETFINSARGKRVPVVLAGDGCDCGADAAAPAGACLLWHPAQSSAVGAGDFQLFSALAWQTKQVLCPSRPLGIFLNVPTFASMLSGQFGPGKNPASSFFVIS
jgi:hypothetical protein